MSGTRFSLEVRPQIPAELRRLPEFANNLIYTWDRDLRGLFRQLDNALYEACGGNLNVFLRRLAQSDLDRAAKDSAASWPRINASPRHMTPTTRIGCRPICACISIPKQDLVAYFCFEFGFHESLPLYSGGLGILAADHCKAASDLALPLVAVGLLYHQGFFEQHIDARGRQIEHYTTTRVEDLPLALVLRRRGPRSQRVGPDRRRKRRTAHLARPRGSHHALSARQRPPAESGRCTGPSRIVCTAVTSRRA